MRHPTVMRSLIRPTGLILIVPAQPEQYQRCIDRSFAQWRRSFGGSSGEIHFQSKIVPKYSRRTNSLEGLIPWPYLKGVSSGNFQEALSALLAVNALNLSADTILRLTVRNIVIS